MKSKIYNIASLGNIEVCKHHNTKRLAIKLKPGGLPRVVIPTLMTYEMGYRFALEKQDWIMKHSQLLSESVQKNIYEGNQAFKTRFHTINICIHDKKNIQTHKANEQINIYIPAGEAIASDKTQQAIRGVITEVLRNEAKKSLIPRVSVLAEQFGFTFNNVFIKNLKSRWGSCSVQNNINLNLHLMRLPEHLSDFIILHELCHTVHKNHGVHFHALLNKLVGNEKPYNSELKNYSSQL